MFFFFGSLYCNSWFLKGQWNRCFLFFVVLYHILRFFKVAVLFAEHMRKKTCSFGIIFYYYLFTENFSFDCYLQVIVRDVVSKSVIVQFRAHESPISALCFDPTGTLLVTASIRGHNINVFHIIVPCPSGRSFGSDPVGTCTHLYRLQRGITNAVDLPVYILF